MQFGNSVSTVAVSARSAINASIKKQNQERILFIRSVRLNAGWFAQLDKLPGSSTIQAVKSLLFLHFRTRAQDYSCAFVCLLKYL